VFGQKSAAGEGLTARQLKAQVVAPSSQVTSMGCADRSLVAEATPTRRTLHRHTWPTSSAGKLAQRAAQIAMMMERMVVASVESMSLRPSFANIATSAAKNAERKA